MTLKVSTGARNALLGGSSLKAALAGGKVQIYGGTVPATADAAVGGATLLCEITAAAGAGINLGTAAGGSIPKDPAEAWGGTNLNSGTASFFRYVAPGDDGTLSATAARLQGTVGTAGADLNMTSVNLTAGAPQTIDACTITLPTY